MYQIYQRLIPSRYLVHHYFFFSVGLEADKKKIRIKGRSPKSPIPNLNPEVPKCYRIVISCICFHSCLITPNQLSVLTGRQGETSSNEDSGEFSLLHCSLFWETYRVREWRRTNSGLWTISCQSGTSGEQPGPRGEL